MPGMFFERALELALKHTGGTAEDLLLPENAEALVANASAYVELWGAFEKGLHEGGARRLEDAASLSRALEAAGLGAEEGGSAWRSIAQDNGVAFEAFAAHVQGRRKSAGQTDAEVHVTAFANMCTPPSDFAPFPRFVASGWRGDFRLQRTGGGRVDVPKRTENRMFVAHAHRRLAGIHLFDKRHSLNQCVMAIKTGRL